MRALILAAGWATRLGALAARTPKHLLPIGSRTSLDFVVSGLEATPSVRRIDVLSHEAHRGRFQRWAEDRRHRTPLAVWGNETRRFEERRGAVGDLAYFVERAAVEEDLLVLGGDQVFDFDLAAIVRHTAREVTIAVHDVGSLERVRRYASVEIDAEGYIERFVEKDPAPRTTLAAPAIYGLPARLLPEVRTYLEAGGAPDNLGFLAQHLVARHRVRGTLLEGRWIDIGSPDEYERARREFGGASKPSAQNGRAPA